MKLAVVIPTVGRADVVGETIENLMKQSRLPDRVIISGSIPGDLPAISGHLSRDVVDTVLGPKGSSVQRNTAMDMVDSEIDLFTFLDDDVELASDYLEEMLSFFQANKTVVAASGNVVYDGGISGEVTRRESQRLVEVYYTKPLPFTRRRGGAGVAHGCNLTVRSNVALGVRFDERLALYGWLEDRDFGARCIAYGRIARVEECRLVHLGVSSGRVNGRRFGFSQIVNPFYLWRKGSLNLVELLQFWLRAFLVNLVFSRLRHNRWDRSGRAAGNRAGMKEVIWRGARPEAVADYVGSETR